MSAQAQRIDYATVWQEGRLDDRRAEARAKTILAYGKITVSETEQICQIRDISPRGIRIETRDMPEVGERVWIEMRGLSPSPATVIWREGNSGGIAFEAEQDLQIIFEIRRGIASRKPRGPRFSLRVPADFSCRAGMDRFEVIDISMGGLKLGGATKFEIGSYGMIRIEGLAEDFSGHIRWKQDDILGFRFDRPMLREDLFNLLSCCG